MDLIHTYSAHRFQVATKVNDLVINTCTLAVGFQISWIKHFLVPCPEMMGTYLYHEKSWEPFSRSKIF